MARAATTSDVFNAIAEPQRRAILVLLRAGERPVTELAQALRMTQPRGEVSVHARTPRGERPGAALHLPSVGSGGTHGPVEVDRPEAVGDPGQRHPLQQGH